MDSKINQIEKLDNLTFSAMYGVLQGGMWLLNDIEKYLAPLNISQGRLAILLSLMSGQENEINPMKIAKLTGKSRPTITRMIERLETDGYIRSVKSGEDGRKKILGISESGERLLSTIIPGYNKRLMEMSMELSVQDKQELLRILGKISFLDPEKKIALVS